MTGRRVPPRLSSLTPFVMPTRRAFAISLGSAALGACVGSPPATPAPAVPVTPAPAPAPAQPATQPNDAAADAMMPLVRQRYGAHLSESQLAQVRDDIRDELDASDRLRAIVLANGVAPDMSFLAFRGADR